MSQEIFNSIDPTISGTELASILNDFKDAVVSNNSGISRPTELAIGGSWVDTTNDPTSWSFKIWTGTDDVEVFSIDLTNGISSVALAVDSFLVKKISADTVGAVLELVKRRIAASGQVADGDVVGEIRFIGRTDTAGNPVVAKIIWTSTDNMTSSSYGGTLSFYSTPDATATLTEHMRFIGGLIETIVPHKLNSQVLVSQDVATTATIAQLSGAKVVVEMTGSTATDIQGINSTHASKVVTIHNRSSAVVTLKHQDAGATAVDRLKLPGSMDYTIAAEGSATLYYCVTDTFWKLIATTDRLSGKTTEKFFDVYQQWTAPAGVTAIKICSYRQISGAITGRSGMLDTYGNAYAWGLNDDGQLGLGDVVSRSSPVPILGGLNFSRVFGSLGTGSSSFGIASNGSGYAWGRNSNGQLGVGDVAARSSPVAILGGLKFIFICTRNASVQGLTTSRFAYAWGNNANGQLGVGDVTPRSSPVAVLGGIRFAKIAPMTGANGDGSVLAVSTAGVGYGWGVNTNGQLGVGDVTARSSPVAILGGLFFPDIQVVATALNRYSSHGLSSTGAAYAWGYNADSRLGVGDQTPRSSPVAVLGGLTFKKLVTHPGSSSIFALTSTGLLYAWGDNTKGVLGVGDLVDRSSPVAVLGGLAFSKAGIYQNSAWGITSDGTAYMWGLNTNGQLGVGDTTARSSPVAVLGGLKFVEIFFSDSANDPNAVYGITTDGLMYAWGKNTNGTLGVGDNAHRSSPVAVVGTASPDAAERTKTVDMTVVPGQTYTILTGVGVASFDGIHLGIDMYRVDLEYLQ